MHLVLYVWLFLIAASVVVLARDLGSRNPQTPSLMKAVWVLTVLYSGPLGLAMYFLSGRRQIPDDALWRRAMRSVAHCYSGCGAGEIVGVLITAGFLSLGGWWVAGTTFVLAYVAGFALTVGPLVQGGVPWGRALRDAAVSETASITVMEVTAIAVGLWISARAALDHPRFWISLVVSLSAGLIAAYPVNVLLIRWGVKEGMHDPRKM